jgi:hypothetical protein
LAINPNLGEWQKDCSIRTRIHTQKLAEHKHATPNPSQVARQLANHTPINHADLMAVALERLCELQNEANNSGHNLKTQFWATDVRGQKPQSPHKPETVCRDAIVSWLIPRLKAQNITVLPETRHDQGNDSDFGLLVGADMLLPIEVKGDWHPELWTAAKTQLFDKYCTDYRCAGRGLYLVLWMNDPSSTMRRHPNDLSVTSAKALQEILQREINQDVQGIEVFVLDLSL